MVDQWVIALRRLWAGAAVAAGLWLADPPQPLTAAAPSKASAVVASAGPRRMGWGQ